MTSRRRLRFLITGSTGQVGLELTRHLARLGDVIAPTRSELDLMQPQRLRTYVRARRPDVIVNAAAYTAVDRAEGERSLCYAVNAEAPGVLADEASNAGAVMIHYSTDYVFDGAKRTPYVEMDTPSPLNVYGESKLAGERAVEAAGGAWCVFRASWVYGAHGDNFVRTILRLAREPRPIRVVDDQVGTPTWCRSVASVTAAVLARAPADELHASFSRVAGLYHVTSGDSTTWLEFARAVIARDPGRHEHCHTELTGITSREFGAPAARPAFSVLCGDKLRTTFGLVLPPWQTQLSSMFAERHPTVPNRSTR